jgi:hypothetical protein
MTSIINTSTHSYRIICRPPRPDYNHTNQQAIAPAILTWAAEQRAATERILARPPLPDHIIAQCERQRIAEIELLLEDNSYIRPTVSLMRLFN